MTSSLCSLILICCDTGFRLHGPKVSVTAREDVPPFGPPLPNPPIFKKVSSTSSMWRCSMCIYLYSSSSSSSGTRISGLPAHQADECGERLLQVGQVCQTGGQQLSRDAFRDLWMCRTAHHHPCLFVSVCGPQVRTRAALLDHLHEELQRHSQAALAVAPPAGEEERLENGGHGGLLESFKVTRTTRAVLYPALLRCFSSFLTGLFVIQFEGV